MNKQEAYQETEDQGEVQDDFKSGLLGRRDQLIAAYNEHGTMLVELKQRLVQVESQRLKLEGAIAMIGEMLGEEPGAAGG